MPDLKRAVFQLLEKGKGPGMEWFPGDVSLMDLANTLMAMANSGGGDIILGVSPRAGRIVGLQDPAGCRDKIFQAALRIEPTLVLPLPQLVQIDRQAVLWIVVPEGLPNVHSLDGRYLGRKGTRNEPLPAAVLRELLIERGGLLFEARVPEGASPEDLDEDRIRFYLESVGLQGQSWQQALLQRGCLKPVGEAYRPTYAGLLLFGKTPQQWLPSATILAAQFENDTFSDQFIKKEMSGTLLEQLQQAFHYLSQELPQDILIQGLEHSSRSQYPIAAVRELLVNAVAHRDYNLQGDCIHINIFRSRLEIHSPGGLPGPVTLENLLQARFSRNPVIVQVLSDLGYVERLGYGLDRVVSVIREQGLPPAEFNEIAGSFRVTLHSRSKPVDAQLSRRVQNANLELNDRQRAVIDYLFENRRVTNREFQELCPEVHPETLRRDLADLVQQGVLIKIGQKRATYYVLKHDP